MEDLFDEKLLEAIRLAEALQDGQSEEKESEGKKTEEKQETENSRPVSRTEEPVAAPVPQTGEEAVDQLIKEIVQETQEEIAAEGIQTEDIRKEFFQKKAEKAKREKGAACRALFLRTGVQDENSLAEPCATCTLFGRIDGRSAVENS